MKHAVTVLVLTGFVAAGVSAWAGGACCAGKSKEKSAGSFAAKAAEPAALSSVADSAVQPASEGKVQAICPVMGAAINKSSYVDHNGKRVYFCCNACVSTFMKDPEKYLKKLADEGVVLEDAPAQ